MKTATAAFLFPQWMKGPLLSDHMWCQSKSFSSIVTCRLNNSCQSVRALPGSCAYSKGLFAPSCLHSSAPREWGFFSKSASVAGPGFFLIPLIVFQNPVSRCGVCSSFPFKHSVDKDPEVQRASEPLHVVLLQSALDLKYKGALDKAKQAVLHSLVRSLQ